MEPREHNRFRFRGTVDELEGRILRVITLEDKKTIHSISGQEVQKMKLNYYRDTDSLYIDLSSKTSTESREISEGIVLDYDAEGNLVGIDIDNASRKIDLKEVILSKIPAEVEVLTA
jgi:uncharacterized protein YuzE